VVTIDVVNTSKSAEDQLTFPGHHQQQQPQTAANDDDEWKQSLGFIQLSSSNLINTTTPAGKAVVLCAIK